MALYASILTGGTNNHTTTSEEANSLATDFVSDGVIGAITSTGSVAPMTGAFAINAQGTPDMTVAVTAGAAYITATPSGQSSQVLRVRLSANENVTIAANSSGSTKYDFLYIKIDPTNAANPNLAGDDVASLVVSRSTSNSTDNGTPPTYGYLLAVITVSNGASSITNGNIRDYRIKSEITSNSSAVSTGWVTNALSAVSTVTHNGNRSYDVVFASTVASILSEGMRLEFTKATAGNAYMGGAFNGSSHYFTKTSPSGTLGTVNNNFTIEAVVQPTSYAAGMICARADAAANNAIYMYMQASGVVNIGVRSAGSGNVREIPTYQSLPLNKKTTIAATWASGTVTISFDGISVPVGAASTSGGAPTTAGTGGDWSIGRFGANATLYFPGYISNVAVFDAVLSASTIKDHYTKKLTGSETNCIGAWSLDNTANDQSSAGNDLTATGGVGYTAMTPHGQLGNGVETTKAVGLVMSVNGTTVTVQCPEGVTIPSGSSTISSVAYSTQANPFGWVSDKGRWGVAMLNRNDVSQASPVANTWYNLASPQLTIPTGAFLVSYKAMPFTNRGTAAGSNVEITLSTGASTNSDDRFTCHIEAGSLQSIGAPCYVLKPIRLTSATAYYLNTRTTQGSASTVYNFGARNETEVLALPAGL